MSENERILAALPLFPGAHEMERASRGYAEGNGPELFAGTAGFTTTVVYRLPANAGPEEVVHFYERRLDSWRLVEELDGPVANFVRGPTGLSVNLENASTGRLELTLDHACCGEQG